MLTEPPYGEHLRVRIGRVFRFQSAHSLPSHPGKCSNLHGHDYKVEIEVEGCRDPNGIVVDFASLKSAVGGFITQHLDHRFLNEISVSETTVENLVVMLWDEFTEAFDDSPWEVTLRRLRIWETDSCYAEITHDMVFEATRRSSL